MPLGKSIATSYQIPAAYWEVTSVLVDVAAVTARFTFSGWTDKATRLAGGDPLTRQDLTYPMLPATLAAIVAGGEARAVANGGSLAGAVNA